MNDIPLYVTRRRLFVGAGALVGASLMPWTIRQAWGARPRIARGSLGDLDWLDLGGRNRRKLLTEDPATGAHTFYLELPASWEGGGVAHYHNCSEEVYVISGDVTLNGRDYLRAGAYLYRPAGIVHGHNEGSQEGCRLIIKTDSALDFNYIPEPASDEEYVLHPSEDGRPHILHLETPQLPWTWHGDGSARYGVKALSEDRHTGAHTRLIRFPAGWSGEFVMSGDASWEWFVAHGAVTLDDASTFAADSYSVRPAGGGEQAFVRAAVETQVLLWRD